MHNIFMHILKVLFVALLSSCSHLPEPSFQQNADELRIANFLGKWCTLSPDMKSCVAHSQYIKGLIYKTCSLDLAEKKTSRAVATVKLNGDTICLKVISSDNNSATPIGYEFCSNTLEINSDLIKYQPVGRREIFIDKRISDDSPDCPRVN
jgi:hypothetical protein